MRSLSGVVVLKKALVWLFLFLGLPLLQQSRFFLKWALTVSRM